MPDQPTAVNNEVIAYLKGRSVPCPRCAYDLRDAPTATCPECGEPLVLKIDSSRVRFGWLLLAFAPGCFSGIAAAFAMIPISVTILQRFPRGQGAPWQLMAAAAFGFASAASVGLMCWHRHRIMAWTMRRQGAFAATVWGVHILAFFLLVFAVWYWQ